MDLDDAKDFFESLGNLGESLAGTIGSITDTNKVVQALVGSIGQLTLGISNQIKFNQDLSKQFVDIAKNATYLEQRNAALAKSFGVNRSAIVGLARQLNTLSKELGIGNSYMQKYAVNIKKMLPTLNQAGNIDQQRYKGLIQVNRALTTQLGLTDQQAEEFTMYATQTGKDARQVTAAAFKMADALDGVSDGKDSMGYFKMIASDIADAGAEIQLQFGKLPGNLEMAALKGRSLGVSLQQMQTTGKNLLNIEQSIGQELEYQLLSGRRLVDASGKSLTNAYRQATVTRDMNKQADILKEILENEGDVLESNLFARQQMSALLGMDEKTLSRSLQKKKLLDSMGPAASQLFELEGTAMEKQAQAMLDAKEIDAKQFKELMDFADNRTTDDILKDQLEVERDSMIANLLTNEKLQDLIDAQSDRVLKQGKAAATGMMLNRSLGELKDVGGLNSVTIMAKMLEKYLDPKKLIETFTDPNAEIETEISAGDDTTIERDMAMIPAGYGDTIISRPEGTIALNNKDSVLAGTDLFQSTNTEKTNNTDMAQFAAMIVAAINNQTSILNTTMRSDPTFGRGLNDGYYS